MGLCSSCNAPVEDGEEMCPDCSGGAEGADMAAGGEKAEDDDADMGEDMGDDA